MSSLKHGVIRWVKRANSDAGLNGEHGNRRQRPTLRKVLEYVKLRRPKENATTMQRRRSEGIDFVGELPVKIVISKLIPMLMDRYVDFCHYLDVSQLWRDRIFQCFQGLHFWMPYEEELRMPRPPQLIQYPQLAEEIYIDWYGEWWMDALLREGNFTSLRKLKVNGPSETKECFIPTLRSIGGNLSHLTIHQLHVSLDDLLLACPKLTSLTLYVHYHIDFKCIALTTWPAITELSIIPNRIRRTTVALICKSFPALQKLELHRCADMQCVLLITDSYPCLKYYSIMAYKIGVTLRASDRGIRQHAHGITHLDLCGPVQLDDNFKDTISLLKKHHATLEWLKLRMCLERDLHGVYSIAYPRLTKLNLDYSGWWILRNAPVLEELVLSCGTIDEHPTVFNLIPATLKTLKIDITPHYKFQHIPDITRYFHRHSAQSNTTYLLKELTIYTHKMENVGMMLEGISHVKQLERLMIRYSDWDASQVDTFIDQLANGCHRLSCLKIYSSTTPSQHAVNALKRLGYLTHFAFNIKDKDSTAGRFWDAIETLTQTKCIEVYTEKMVQLLEMRRIKENRPDLEVIVNRRVLPF